MKKLGFGAMRLPLIDPQDKSSIDIEELKRMIDTYMAAGFTYFDTAFPYHEQLSENALKEALVDRYDRDSYVLADKMPTVLIKSGDEYPVYFNKQLEKTGVGYFDYYLMHNMGRDRYFNTDKWGGFEFAKRMKEEGKIKNFGFSFHDDAAMLDQILTEHPEVDFVQLQINYLDWENKIIQSRACYEVAGKHNKPIAVMEPVKGGTLADLPDEALSILKEYNEDASTASYALRFAAQLPGVFMVLSGMSNLSQVQDNIRIMDNPQPLNDKEKELLGRVVVIINNRISIQCTSCGYCMEVCPKNINIPGLFALYNNYCINNNFSNMYHGRLTMGRGKASDCVKCHRCEKNCPQHISIPDKLSLIAAHEKK